MSCKYATALGVPGEGAHRYGAVLDWAMTAVAAGILGFVTAKYTDAPVFFAGLLWFLGIYLLAILLHWAFCVNTRVNRFLRIARS